MPEGTLRLLVMRLPVDPDRGADAKGAELSVAARTALIGVGGAAGALARAGTEAIVPSMAHWPAATLAINVSGAGLLAVLLVIAEELVPRARVPGPLLGTGLLGGYTTFSTFAVETVRLAQAGRAGLAVAYVVGSVVGALLAALAGLLVGRALSRLSRPRQFRRRVRRARTLEQAGDRR